MIPSALIVIIFFAAYLFPRYYISELTISFLPYMIAITFIIIIMGWLHLRRGRQERKSSGTPIRKYMLRGLIFTGATVLFLILSQQFNGFYNMKSGSPTPGTQTNTIKILYANIHKDNADYTGIENTIQTANPDLIMFVEFAAHHYDHLKDFLKKDYPYINRTTRSKTFIGSMVFSKYKITNRADNFPQGARRYAYFSLQATGARQYFYLVHTSSPDSPKHFEMRNEQLSTFSTNFKIHTQSYRDANDKVMILGDFNLSPWSWRYKTFENELGTGFIDISRSFPILFTWRLKELPLFWSHIDHVWTNQGTKDTTIESISIPGSDHGGFLITIN